MDGLTAFINDAPLFLIAALLFAALCLLREAGCSLRRRVVTEHDESADKGYLFSGMLGLLALLIAFTFGLAVDRFEARRNLVVDEANAIGTAEMRTQMLPPPDGTRLTNMLRDYARTRETYGLSPPGDRPTIERASAAQPLGPFVGQSINSVLDIGVEREAMNEARVPLTILRALVLYALLTAAMLGYGLAGPRARHRGTTVIFFGLLTLSILLILDLDRPQSGSIRINQAPMTQLVAGFPPRTQAGQ
jgi:hypothetical protein